jgi:hypothetical protein
MMSPMHSFVARHPTAITRVTAHRIAQRMSE